MQGLKQIYADLLELETVQLWNCVLGHDNPGAFFHLDTEWLITDVLKATGDELAKRALDFVETRIPQYSDWLVTQEEEKQDTVAAMCLPYLRKLEGFDLLASDLSTANSLSDLENDLLDCFRQSIDELRFALTIQDEEWAGHQLEFMHNIPTLIRKAPISINSPHVYFCDKSWPSYFNWCMESQEHSALVRSYDLKIARIKRGLSKVIAEYTGSRTA